MSREIKFRAWDEKNKQFADYEDIEECLSCQAMDGWRSSDGMGCCFGINAVEILADCIIEQYTGLKDKNGKKIYEGDIVKGETGVFEVRWYAEIAKFRFKPNTAMKWYPCFVQGTTDYMEVVGTIHENPELLEDK